MPNSNYSAWCDPCASSTAQFVPELGLYIYSGYCTYADCDDGNKHVGGSICRI